MTIGGVGPRPGPGGVDDAPAADTTTTPGAPAPTRGTTPARPTPPAAPAARTVAPASAHFLAQIEVGHMEDGTDVRFDPTTGQFSAKGPDGKVLTGNAALYKAAEVVAEGNADFLGDPKLGSTGRMKLEASLERALATVRPAPAGSPKSVQDLQARSGAATLALAMARKLGPQDPLGAKMLNAYVQHMGKEPVRGLMASMQLNLRDASEKGLVKLSPAQGAALAQATEKTLPSSPPYDKWFANGKQDLKIHQYIHPEFYDAMRSGYDALGFKVVKDSGDGNVTLQKTFTGANGKQMPVTVDITKTYAEDKRPERRLFNDMNDPSVQMEMYTGHSNLGGNVLGALASGPGMQQGDKWVIDWMCRGKQVLADVYNKYPQAAYTTTTDPAYVIQSDKFLNAMLQGIADRKGYDQIWDNLKTSGFDETDMFMKPNDPRILGVRSLDDSGRVDSSPVTGVDPLYKAGLAQGKNTAPFLEPTAPPAAPEDIAGHKVMQGVNFMNTLLTYHLDTAEHPNGNDGRLPPANDKLFAGGWYKSSGDEVCKITKKDVGGETFYEVQVNSKYANQDIHALGAAICYEVNKYLSQDKNGSYTETDKLRGGLMAADYLAYMADTYEQADGVLKAMQKKYGFNDRFTWDNANKAINGDNSGYCSPDAEKILKGEIGSADPAQG